MREKGRCLSVSLKSASMATIFGCLLWYGNQQQQRQLSRATGISFTQHGKCEIALFYLLKREREWHVIWIRHFCTVGGETIWHAFPRWWDFYSQGKFIWFWFFVFNEFSLWRDLSNPIKTIWARKSFFLRRQRPLLIAIRDHHHVERKVVADDQTKWVAEKSRAR